MKSVITKIEPQKKNKKRFSIYNNNEFIIGVSDVTLLKFNLHVGVEINEDLIEKIKNKEDFYSLKDSAYRFLSRRQQSVKELKDKLNKKSGNTNLINKVINELLDKNYLNDLTFAKVFLKEEIKLKKNGPLLIKSKLFQKGVSREIIDSLISSDYTDGIKIENCTYLAEKKLRSLNKTISGQDKKRKLINFLKQKGYDWETCDQVIHSIIPGGNDNEDE